MGISFYANGRLMKLERSALKKIARLYGIPFWYSKIEGFARVDQLVPRSFSREEARDFKS